MIEARLSDGRRYLTGEEHIDGGYRLAALMAPALFPAEYRGALPGT